MLPLLSFVDKASPRLIGRTSPNPPNNGRKIYSCAVGLIPACHVYLGSEMHAMHFLCSKRTSAIPNTIYGIKFFSCGILQGSGLEFSSSPCFQSRSCTLFWVVQVLVSFLLPDKCLCALHSLTQRFVALALVLNSTQQLQNQMFTIQIQTQEWAIVKYTHHDCQMAAPCTADWNLIHWIYYLKQACLCTQYLKCRYM